MLKKLRINRLSLIFLSIVLMSYFTYDLTAKKDGYSSRTSTLSAGCDCHGSSASAGTVVTVTSSTGSFTVNPSSTTTFTLKVANSTTSLVAAGCDIGVKTSVTGDENAGTLAQSNTDLKVINSELSHTQPKSFSSQAAEFNFTWTAPSTPGKYYMRAVGNAVNNNNTYNGDQWNWMSVQEVIVAGVKLTEPIAYQSACAGTTMNIKWESAGIDKIKIELSSDGGASWPTVIVDNFTAFGGVYSWNIPSGITQSTNYKIKITDISDGSRSSVSENPFGIYGNVAITKHPQSQDICEGDNLTLSVETSGLGATYQWRRNGAAINGATQSTYTINNVTKGAEGIYGVIINSQCMAMQVSNDADVMVRTKTKILSQPTSKIVCSGGSTQFSVDADGQNVTYQWFKNNIEMNGETTKTLTINNATPDNEATYHVLVKGYCKPDVKSNSVTLSIGVIPEITSSPTQQTICEGNKLTLSTTATGTEIQYQWIQNDKPILLSNTASYTFDKITPSNAGIYKVVAYNNCGSDTSNPFDVIVNPSAKIVTQPKSLKQLVGTKAEFSIIGTNIKTYQWRKDGKNLDGKTESKLIIEAIAEADSGSYDCVVTNDCNSVTSIAVKLTIDKPAPGARIQVSKSSLDCGLVLLGKSNRLDSIIQITNIGDAKLTITKMEIKGTDASDFKLDSLTYPIDLESGKSLYYSINFAPSKKDNLTANLEITSNSISTFSPVPVNGFGGEFNSISNIKTIDFGTKIVGDSLVRNFRLINQGNYTLSNLTFKITGDTPDDFSVYQYEDSTTIPVMNSHDIYVKYQPLEVHNSKANLEVYFPMIETPITLSLFGKSEPNDVKEVVLSNKVLIYPNPSNNNLNLEFNSDLNTIGKVTLIDINGRILKSYNHLIFEGLNKLNIDVNEFNVGSYQLNIQSGDTIFLQKFEIIK